tara:strand:+ start:5828 stop:6391 length:564 start_codon:yes stop_codon:yes gene_type:complete
MKRKFLRLGAGCFLAIITGLLPGVVATAGFATTVPVSADSATSIARSLFPISVASGTGTLFLTDPTVVFIDDRRLGLKVHFQAYENRPEMGIAISEKGQALVSGEVGYDPASKQVLLYNASIDELVFDSESAVTQRLRADIQSAWKAQFSNPIRADLPPHPLILPFRDGIQDVNYDRRSIYVQVVYK